MNPENENLTPTTTLTSPSVEQPKSSVQQSVAEFFLSIKKILLSPSLFFKEDFLKWSMSRTLVFALIVHWIGTALDYLKTLAFQITLKSPFETFLDKLNESGPIDSPLRNHNLLQFKERLSQWYYSMGSVLMDPISTLFTILSGSILIWVGIRLFTKKSDSTSSDFDHAFKLVCISMTPVILNVIPLSSVFVPLYSFVLLYLGVKAIFQTSSERSLIIALFPKLLWIGFILFLIAAFISAIVVPIIYLWLN